MRERDRGAAYALYEAVQRALAAKGWTTTDLKRESGVARSTVSGWATRPRPPQKRSVRAVAESLGMDLDDALRMAGIIAQDGEPEEAPAAGGRDDTLEALQAQLKALLDRMSPAERERWLAEMRREEVERLERYMRLLGGRLPPKSD